MKLLTANVRVRNEECFVKQAIESILPAVGKVLVFDTGSTDRTVERILEIKDPRVEIVHKPPRDAAGLAQYRNEMTDLARTEWFWNVDGDEVYPLSAVRRVREFLRTVPDHIHRIAVHRKHFYGSFNFIGKFDVSGRIYRASRIRTRIFDPKYGNEVGHETPYDIADPGAPREKFSLTAPKEIHLFRKVKAGVRFPAGSYPVFAGAAKAKAQAQREILLYSILAGVGIVLLLSVVLGHWRNLLLVLANLPFALMGGVLAVFLTGGWLSVGSLVGFVTLFGITVRNSIMMVSHYEHLVAEEGMSWSQEAAWRGASERLVPILMTALVTGLGLLPLALGRGEPGREIEGPMAVVILGGLVTSTILNLFVLPTLALRYGRFEKMKRGI